MTISQLQLALKQSRRNADLPTPGEIISKITHDCSYFFVRFFLIFPENFNKKLPVKNKKVAKKNLGK